MLGATRYLSVWYGYRSTRRHDICVRCTPQSACCLVVSNLAVMHPPAVLKPKCAATGFPEFSVPIYAAISAAGHAEEAVADHDQAEW